MLAAAGRKEGARSRSHSRHPPTTNRKSKLAVAQRRAQMVGWAVPKEAIRDRAWALAYPSSLVDVLCRLPHDDLHPTPFAEPQPTGCSSSHSTTLPGTANSRCRSCRRRSTPCPSRNVGPPDPAAAMPAPTPPDTSTDAAKDAARSLLGEQGTRAASRRRPWFPLAKACAATKRSDRRCVEKEVI